MNTGEYYPKGTWIKLNPRYFNHSPEFQYRAFQVVGLFANYTYIDLPNGIRWYAIHPDVFPATPPLDAWWE